MTLLLLAPLVAEVLPGATRMSSIVVFPLEMIIWGGGAAIARDLVRRFGLSWVNLLLLALALAVAEECLIQQTSYASLVVQIRGVEYGRAFGVNYVYLAWALIYESLFVVMVPVALAELIFPARKREAWLAGWAYAVLAVLAVPASFAAWYGWNIVARPKVFHLPPYHLPLNLGLAGAAGMVGLVVIALGSWRARLTGTWTPLTPPRPVIAGLAAALVTVLLFGLEVLAFGIAPDLHPVAAIALALVIAAACFVVPRWAASPEWSRAHVVALVTGSIVANCLALYASFTDASALDLVGKTVLDLIAFAGLGWLARARARA
ncbi:MAG TPA: hypothetical protein VIC34_01120 [Croceibacterium sp.]